MNKPTVALTRCTDYSRRRIADSLQRQFELLGGIDKFIHRGDSVLLKPNLIAPKSRRCATQTDPAVIIETAKLVKDIGGKPFVADSPAWGNIFTCVKALKMDGELRKLAVPVRPLDKPVKRRIAGARVALSSTALEADKIINLPKFKTHQQLVATFAIKNMFGTVPGKQKAYWHFARGKTTESFCELLIEIYKFLNPALTIIDAVIAMDSGGPINGRARPLGWLIGGVEPVSCELVCCKLINAEPEQIPIIQTAKRMGFGCRDIDEVEIVGDGFSEKICTDFELPELVPVRFSLLRICKSICKQILLLTKSAVTGKSRNQTTKK